MLKLKRVRGKKRKYYVAAGVIASAIIAGLTLFYYVDVKPLDLSFWEGYQNLASPNARIVRITPGLRKEQVADRFAKVLGWSEAQKKEFLTIHTKANGYNPEGYYFPGTYLLAIKSTPEDASKAIQKLFKEKIISKLDTVKNKAVSLDAAIRIASIIEREAGSLNDMKIISGVIWNRMYQGMSLQMDATLQYAKGNSRKWWPVVVSEDKFIDSPYNTYKNEGLPPTAISNPSESAIWAAYNPIKTASIFYLHDPKGNIHTAVTYKEHLANIQRYYKK